MNIVRVYIYSLYTDNKAWEFKLLLVKLIFRRLNIQLSLLKPLIYILKVQVVLFFSLRKDQNIIQVYNIEVVYQSLKGLINIGLEGYRGIYKAYRYNYEFVVSIISVESRLPFVTYLDSKVVIYVLKVDFTKVFSPYDIVYNLSNQW